MIVEQMELNRHLTTNKTMNKTMRSSLLWCLPFLIVLLWIEDAQAQFRTFALKQGAVMARSLALDENKQPILVEYDEQGEELRRIDIPKEYAMEVAKLKVVTAFEYQQEKIRLAKFQELHKNDLGKDAEVMQVDTFKETEFLNASGKSIAIPTLPNYVKSVLVRGRSARISTDPKELVLLSFSVDLSQEKTVPDKGSLLLNDKGQVIYTTSNNIAPRVGFFGDPNEKQEFFTSFRKTDDKIFGPVKYVKVYISPEAYPGSMTSSDYRGKYSMSFMLPYCPGGFEYTTDAWAELRYANFSPYGSPTIPYYLRRQDWTYCYDLPPFSGSSLGAAMDYVNAIAVLAAMSVPVYNVDFKVDVMFLSGRILLRNPDGSTVNVGNNTEYEVTTPDDKRIGQENYDLDGDGKPDRVVLGRIVNKAQADGTTKKVFEAYPAEQAGNITDENALQGVYLSSSTKGSGLNREPDFVRLADTKKSLSPNGKLKSISKDDLKNTDIYVFRESTGQLVLERNGLKDEEIASRVDIGLGKDDQYYYYRLMLRGPMDHQLNIGAINRSKNWEEWAEEYRLAEPFRKRESDYLKSGEWVRLVVINRATGYTGTQRIQLGDASKNAGSMLSVKLNDTWLQPPNLKVWAERKYTIDKGIVNKDGKDKHYLIGQEGAALTSDTLVEVFTEWLDEENRPLPEGLGADDGQQYGLSGRLARTTGKNVLASVGGDLANFAIPPGRNIQVLKISDNLTTPENFYVHVVGTQLDEKPNFGGNNTAEGLTGRPEKFTPFLTPIYDENRSWQTFNAWIKAREINSDAKKPVQNFTWSYRPEYQFSQYSLDISGINRISADGTVSDLLNDPKSLVRSDDQLLQVFYSLTGSLNERLDPIDGPQDLIIAIGAEEFKVKIGSDGTINFDSFEHLAALSPEDFLSIRLYTNQDAENILWQYGFETQYEIRLTMLIPLDHVKLSTSFIPLPIHDYIFEGDNRAVSKVGLVPFGEYPADLKSEHFRIRQTVQVTPGSFFKNDIPESGVTARFDTDSSLSEGINCYRKFCPECSKYLGIIDIKVEGKCITDEARNDPNYQNADLDDDINGGIFTPGPDDDYLKEAAGKADIDSIKSEVLEARKKYVKVFMEGDPGNAIVKWSPDFSVPRITWNINLAIEEIAGGLIRVTVDGEHDGFPGYELSVRKPGEKEYQLIYSYDPIPNGGNPHNLAAPMDIDISPAVSKVL